MLLDARNIPLRHQRLENEIIPLRGTDIEVVLAEVDVSDLRLDPTNPRIKFALCARNKKNPTEKDLEEILWEDPDVKRLKRSIETNGGIIEAIIVSGKDGTIFEGNCRVTCDRKLAEEYPNDPTWKKIKARILPPTVDRQMVDVLLGELHLKGKNKWSPFEQAAHLYRMNVQKGITTRELAEMFRESNSYISAKIRAYRLMNDSFVPMAQTRKKPVQNLPGYWSWFDELFKKCKPSAPGNENPNRVYDGRELEERFCDWVLENKLPRAEDVRKLSLMLEDEEAMGILEKQGVEKAYEFMAATRPELSSKLWKLLQSAASSLDQMPLSEIDAIRHGDAAREKTLNDLFKAVEKVRKELRK